jgi:hypothetical protein
MNPDAANIETALADAMALPADVPDDVMNHAPPAEADACPLDAPDDVIKTAPAPEDDAAPADAPALEKIPTPEAEA